MTAPADAIEAAVWALSQPAPERSRLITGYRLREVPTTDSHGFPTRNFDESNAWIIGEYENRA